MLNATWLETFTTLCETAHFTRAAELLNMTQPGVSQHLRKLEEQVGQPLILRERKSFSLTSAGEAVFALGLSRRAEEQNLRESIATDDRDSGVVRIACSGSFAMLLYPDLLPWMNQAPNLAVHLEAAPQATVLAGLLDGRFDLGVLESDPSNMRLDAQHLGREELCLLLPAGCGDRLPDMQELDERGLIAHPDGYSYADELLGLNFPGDYPGAERLRVRAYVNQIGQIPTPVAQGFGYTLLPRSGVEAYGRKDRLSIVDLPKRRWRELWLAARHDRIGAARLVHASTLITAAALRLKS